MRYLLSHGLLCTVHLYELYHESAGCYSTGARLEWHRGYVIWGLCVVHPYELHHEPWLLLHWSSIGVVSWLCYMKLCCGNVMVMLWLPLQGPGERLCYGCRASQERINVSAVPMAPWVFFQPLSSSFAYPGFSEQCEQQKNWHCEPDQWYTALLRASLPPASFLSIPP